MKKYFLLLISVFCLFIQAKADDALTLTADKNVVTENFDGMWDAANSTATLNMPAGWRIDRQMSAPRMVGAYSTAATEVMYTGDANLPAMRRTALGTSVPVLLFPTVLLVDFPLRWMAVPAVSV